MHSRTKPASAPVRMTAKRQLIADLASEWRRHRTDFGARHAAWIIRRLQRPACPVKPTPKDRSVILGNRGELQIKTVNILISVDGHKTLRERYRGSDMARAAFPPRGQASIQAKRTPSSRRHGANSREAWSRPRFPLCPGNWTSARPCFCTIHYPLAL